ncbi:ABC transporter permease [uncultured Sphaerochaeta sp.]|jgi:peptide/nickel transport system permease protein|uniref:ABC transporter permease n=1 Tax=uncultured Sphaerochaeta sp. TaxID=886478 RepID=UPI002AA86BC3|nr:ABC transporter permease [uncultured Sphaerochaeta sp.]
MGKYILRRLLWMIPVILGVTILIFTIMFFIPGDPVKLLLGPDSTPEQVEAKRVELGLDDSYLTRLGRYVGGIVTRFDFGESWVYNTPVTSELLSRLPRTLAISLACMLLQIFIGIPLGVVAAVNHNKWGDRVTMFIALIGISMPEFWVALMLVLLFALNLGWLPPYGIGSWVNYILPVIALSLAGIATQARQTRSSMLEVIRSDYITTARSKGMSEMQILFKHALPNALLPVITVIGNGLGRLLAGAVVIEAIFSIPGVGMYLVGGINTRDYNVVMSSVIILAIVFALIMLLVDLMYAAIDPRIKSQFTAKKKRRNTHA